MDEMVLAAGADRCFFGCVSAAEGVAREQISYCFKIKREQKRWFEQGLGGGDRSLTHKFMSSRCVIAEERLYFDLLKQGFDLTQHFRSSLEVEMRK